MAHHYAQSYAKKDFYKLLRVPSSATTAEIKASYRKIAMELHPDRNDGCDIKSALFKQINEAYSVLMDTRLRREYDQVHGIYARRAAGEHASQMYRKVYAPSPPPEWKGKVWDHAKHYDYHYGDGFQKEAFDRLRKQAEEDMKHKRGPYHYESPLGKGFSFGDSNDKNPYSKRSPQGPPKMVFDYEESYIHMDAGKQSLHRRDRIVHDLHARRGQRLQRTKTTSSSDRSSSNDSDHWQEIVSHVYGVNKHNAASNSASKNTNVCVIL